MGKRNVKLIILLLYQKIVNSNKVDTVKYYKSPN